MKFICPQCGTEMKLDEESGGLSCPSCKHSEQIAGYEKDFLTYRHVRQVGTFGDEEARLYVCKTCGMGLVTNNRTALSTCYFCGNAMNLGERLSGDLCPAKLLPFMIPEKKARKAFSRWFLKTRFSPKEFRRKRKECECHAMYLPVWMFQMRGQGVGQMHAVRSKKTIDPEEKEKVIETEHFDIYRRFDLGFDHLAMSASDKVDQRIFDALQPFDFDALKPFDTHMDFQCPAEQYRWKDSNVEKIAEKRVKEAMDEYLLQTVSGYQDQKITEREYQIGKSGTEFLWLPVYFSSLDIEDPDYLFVMNGQTGKVAFDPPYSVAKILAAGGLCVTFAFLVIRVIILILGGALL